MTPFNAVRLFALAISLLELRLPAQSLDGLANSEDITEFLRDNFADKNSGMVVGIVDEHGTRIFASGKMGNPQNGEVDRNTIFEIGSITKTFTVLLLMDMVDRGEMSLDDPVAKYLPESVKLPVHGGKQITLLNLAAQDSGLPFNANNHSGSDWKERYESYSVARMYEFLSEHSLSEDPGTKFQYSNLGVTLLGHVIALKAGRSFESLVKERICQLLHMDSTGIALSSSFQSRLALGHDRSGAAVPSWNLDVMAGAGGLRSSVNDLLKYVSANLGLTQSSLTPLMQKMHVIRHREHAVEGDMQFGSTAMPWYDGDVYQTDGEELLGHAGGTGGYSAFIGFDRKGRRGVVVLLNQSGGPINSSNVGWLILQHQRLGGIDVKTMAPLRQSFGTGVAFGKNKETGMLEITKVFPNSPAALGGLSKGLLIQKINGVPTIGREPSECINLFKSNPTARVEISNSEGADPRIVELRRQNFLTSNEYRSDGQS